MRYLISAFFLVFMLGCAVPIVEMSEQPTVQKYDLTDADADGVILARELCPESFEGAKVGNRGCGAEKTKAVRRQLMINFDTNSYQIKPAFYNEIKGLADFMNEYPSVKVTIEGHTSKRGSRVLNQTLSQNRAQAIKDKLVADFAINKNRITAIGYGFDRLLLQGDDEYIHSQNRRIVVEMSAEKQIKNMKWTIYSVDQPTE